MLWFVCLLNYADRQAIFSAFPKLQEEFGFTKTQLGLIGSAFMWVYAGAAPFAGAVGDLVRRKDLILGGCIFWSAVTVMTGWCSKLWHFVTVRAMEGFGETFYFPASMSLLSDYHSKKTRSRAMAFHQSSVYAGTILGSWVGAYFAEKHNWRLGFYLFGVLGIVLALALYKFLREPQRAQAEAEARALPPCTYKEGVAAIFRSPAAILILLGFVCANFVATIFLTWTPTFLVEKFNFRLTTAGLSGTVYIHAASALSVPIAGYLADRLSEKFGAGRLMIQIAGLAGGSVFVFLVGHTQDVATLIAAMTLFGLCKGFYDSNIFAALFDVVDPRVRSTAAGIMNTVGWSGGALGALAVGWFAEHGGAATEVENMSHAISYGGGVYLAGALLLVGAARVFPKDPGKGANG